MHWGHGLRRLAEDRYTSILAVAAPVLVAAIVFAQAVSTYPQLPILGDPIAYHMTAQRLITRSQYCYSFSPPQDSTVPNADVTPGYPTFLASLYVFRGLPLSEDSTSDALAIQPFVSQVQFVLVLGTVSLVATCGLLLGGPLLALLSGLLAAFHLPFAWSSSVALGESLATALIALELLLALLITETNQHRRTWLVLAFGIVAATATMVRPVMIVWTVVPLLYLAVFKIESPRRLLVLSAVATTGVLIVLGPWWIRNVVVLDDFIPLSGQFGGIVSFGSNAASGWWHSVWTSIRIPWSAALDVYWSRWNTPEVPYLYSGPFAAEPTDAFARSVAFAWFYQAALLVLALPALLRIRKEPRLLVVASLPLYLIGVHALTMFIGRYFLPPMTAVVLLAAVTVQQVVTRGEGLSRS